MTKINNYTTAAHNYTTALNNSSASNNAVTNTAPVNSTGATTGATTGFANTLDSFVQEAINSQTQAEQAGLAAATGQVNIADIVMTLSKAEMALKSVIAIRDKIIQAYQDIIKMPI